MLQISSTPRRFGFSRESNCEKDIIFVRGKFFGLWMIMEIEKRRSKGNFLSFFDWNGKSQKKLFFDNPNKLPDVSTNQGKENMDNMPKSQIKMDDSGENPSNTASCDFGSTLSISSSDEGCGTKAPGLVARLMGLDTLPVSTASQFSSTSLYGSNSLGSSQCNEISLHSVADYYHVDSINMTLKKEKYSWGAMESKAHKVGNPAINRFQNETLPPKSAKPISVTHNKLLSSIKNHGHIPPKNATHIMEEAAKIIEANLRPYMRNRMSSAGAPSAPLRILDLKEKLEGAQHESKLKDMCIAIPVNGKPTERGSNLYKSTPTFKGSGDSEKNSPRPGKGKSVSLAIPSKANVQSRETLTLKGNTNRRYMKQKEQNELKSNQLSGSQKKQITDRSQVMRQKNCTGQNSNVLRQNNQKQNSVTNKGKSTSKADTNKPTQTCSSESSAGDRKTTNKGAVNASIESKRSSTRVTDKQKEFSVSKRKSFPQKNRYVRRDDQNGARGSDNAANTYESKSIKCNVTIDGSIDQDAFSMKESSDVISFTFTSPLRRNMPESQSTTEQVMGTRTGIDVNSSLYPGKLSLSPTRLRVIDGDTLSVLLEKKLQELTSKINPPQCTLTIEGCSGGFRSIWEDKFHSMDDNCCSSSDNMALNMNLQPQISEPMEEPSCSSSSESENDLSYQHARTVRTFENPFSSRSYLDSEDSTCGGSTVYSSMQHEEVSNSSPINESMSLENMVKWSDQRSSTVIGGNMAIKEPSSMSNLVDFTRSARKMELEYVKDILSNAELMAEEFVVGQTDKIIMPNLFDLLENQRTGAENCEEYSKLERKAVFDSVSECLELKCRQVFVGSCKAWPKWVASVQSKSWLAEQLYKEMLSFRSMEEEVLVDELVSKDMSTRWGRWLDFDIEAFEEGLELEVDIVTYLIEELVSDLWLV